MANLPGVVTLVPSARPEREIVAAFTSDLLSDVMANASENSVLITLQAHKNTIACASLAGVAVVLLAGHLSAGNEVVQAATQEGIALLGSPENQFQLSVRVGGLLKSS
ncbi:MAG: hypothetical protein HKM06_05245 [Spirochaetales bacterium]|nr:hypothetical protein [Spirochaetales bacterium]